MQQNRKFATLVIRKLITVHVDGDVDATMIRGRGARVVKRGFLEDVRW